jgi:hypothetical protein
MASGTPLKRVWTRPLDGVSFWGSYIERMGNDFEFGYARSGVIPEAYAGIRCYSDSNLFYAFGIRACDYQDPTGIDDVAASSIVVYPNPASHAIHLAIDYPNEVSYQILDMAGQSLAIGLLHPHQRDIDISSWSEGVYLLDVIAGGVHARQRFAIVK